MHLLQRPWIGTAYISLYSTHARGVSVLVHRSILFSCARVEVNTEGRFVCLLRTIFSQTLVLAALYIHPPYWGVVLGKILSFLDVAPGVPVLFIRDFNNILHPYWDRFHTGSVDANSRPTSLSKILDEVGLRDLWWLRFPDSR